MKNTDNIQQLDIQKLTFEAVNMYKDMSMFEHYAMFMGKCQLLELSLKGILHNRYGVSLNKTKRWTMGRVKAELSNSGLREDFIKLLDKLVEHRNQMAHEYLANLAITEAVVKFSEYNVMRPLRDAIFELEQLIIIYDWCNENDEW